MTLWKWIAGGSGIKAGAFTWMIGVLSAPLVAAEQQVDPLQQAYNARNCDAVYEQGMRRAENGDSRAQLFVGLCKLRFGGRDESQEAVKWLDTALRNGEAGAARHLAIHFSGLVQPESKTYYLLKVCKYSEMGARLGDEITKGYLQGFNCKQVYKDAENEPQSIDKPLFAEEPPVSVANGQEILFTYLGKPIAFTTEVSAFCRDDKSGAIADCHFRGDERGRYWIDRLPKGRYVLRVAVDENKNNPPEGPGDYWRYFQFKVTDDSYSPLRVSMQRLIHLIEPADNNGVVDGNSGNCEQKPHFEVPLLSLLSKAKIKFAWQPLEPDLTYHYTLWKANCSGGGVQRLVYKQTEAMAVVESLPPNKPDEFYFFRITAVKNGEMVGDFFLRDNGGSGMRQYRFRVSDPLGFRDYAYYVLAGLLIVVLLFALKMQRRHAAVREKAVKRASGSRSRDLGIILLIILLGAGGYYGYDYYDQLKKEEQQVKARSAKEERQAHMRAEFEVSVPLPGWWSEIGEPKFLFNTHSDIVAMMPGISRAEEALSSRRTLIKQCYLSIVAHADDDNLVTACLSMIADLEEDKRIVLKAAEFGIGHYFNHQHTTDYCSGCKPGDTMAAIVARAAGVYSYSGEYGKAMALIRRFLKSREKETSDHRLESLYASLGRSYWELGEHQKAVELLEKAYRRFGKEGKRSNLSYYLERYRKQLSDTAHTSQAATTDNRPVSLQANVVSGARNSVFPSRIEGRWLGTFNPESRFTMSDGTRMRGIALNVTGQSATVSLIDSDELSHELNGSFSVRREGESMTLSGYVSSPQESGLWSINVADMGLPDLHLSVTAMLSSSVNGRKVKRTAVEKGTIARQ